MFTPLNYPSVPASAKAKLRDDRLDFWRGICLADMVLVHLVFGGIFFGPWLITQILGEYLRFAAGGFIMIAGMTISAIYGPRLADVASRARSYRAIWQRSLFLLAVHVASVMSFKVMDVLWGAHLEYSLPETIWRIATLRYGSDLLLFYSVMLMAVPPLLELMRRWKSTGVILVAALSILLFLLNEPFPYTLWSVQDGHFPVMLWQLLFIAGMLAGRILPAYDKLRTWGKVTIAAGFTIFTSLIYLLAYGAEWNLPIAQTLISFRKIPLTAGEVLRYIGVVGTIITWTDIAWPMIRNWRISRLLSNLGRRSLPVYICHVWLVSLACWACQWLWWIDAWQGMSFLVVMGILLIIVNGLDRLENRKLAQNSAPAIRKPALDGPPRWLAYLPRPSQLMPKLVLPAMTFVLSCICAYVLLNTFRAPADLAPMDDGYMAAVSEPTDAQPVQDDQPHTLDEWPRPTTSY